MKTISPNNKFRTSEEAILNLSGYTKIDPKKENKKKKSKKAKKVKNIKITKHKRTGILDVLAESVKVKLKKDKTDSNDHTDEIVKTGVDIVTSIISAIKK